MNFNKLYKYLYMVILIFLGIYLINSSNNSNYNDDKKQTSAQRYENTEKYSTPNPTQEDKDILEQNVNSQLP